MTEMKVSVPQQPKVTPRRFPKNRDKQSKLPVRQKRNIDSSDLQNVTNNVTGKLQELLHKYSHLTKDSTENVPVFFLSILNREPYREMREINYLIREQKKKKVVLQEPSAPKQSREEIRLNSVKEQTEKLRTEIEVLERENAEMRHKKISNNLCKRKVGSVALTRLRSAIDQLIETNHILEQNIELIQRRIRLMTQHRSSLHISDLVDRPAPQPQETPSLPPLVSKTLTLVNCCSFTITNI